MLFSDALRLALRAVTAQRLRSFLTLLGIAVGIAAVILLTSIGEGVHRFVLAEFSQFGTNIIGVAPGRVKTGGAPPSGLPTAVRPLSFDDARALQRLPNVTAIGPVIFGNAEIEGNGRTRRTTVYGVTEDALQVFNMRVATGQFLPPDEWEGARAFVVLGAEPQAGETVADLGAAPGGWSYQLVRRGLSVVAIDNGAIAPSLMASGMVEHLRVDGFTFEPRRRVDWLVCDMIEQPYRVAQRMAVWFNRHWADHLLFNLKLPMKKRRQASSSVVSASVRIEFDFWQSSISRLWPASGT